MKLLLPAVLENERNHWGGNCILVHEIFDMFSIIHVFPCKSNSELPIGTAYAVWTGIGAVVKVPRIIFTIDIFAERIFLIQVIYQCGQSKILLVTHSYGQLTNCFTFFRMNKLKLMLKSPIPLCVIF